MEPRRGVVAPELERWRLSADEGERRSVIVRFRGGADPTDRLVALGVEVVSRGAGSVTGVVTPEVLHLVGQQTWVLAVEGPRTLRSLQSD
ncbi:hypothetical protein LFM09_07180 [Lentzea alba]|uniref:hypothetical protein n=1 Tax=Lentzea alba TaxID=2714351 RepID=UPI0039BFA995